jgi:hypothetical protein
MTEEERVQAEMDAIVERFNREELAYLERLKWENRLKDASLVLMLLFVVWVCATGGGK